ncbi:uncharacterized protein MIR9-1HG isoform X3 [Hylobates moloch]|uniref:uncharacterized protein MIR9-1HG isoform X3 n=1 Tax=Hylobates moloch TaxID=81572 RepID=UPI0026772823|nr:uncharacterized protein MIR9-1HG isoform X3 [Hylobates moloch]
MSSEFLEDAVSHSSSKSGGQACMVDDGACLQAGICVHRLCWVKTLTCLWYTQIGPNNQARQDADNVWPQISNWIAREMNFVGENIRTSKCWPSSPRKMRPPPALSLHLPTVTVSFKRRAARERKREASEIPEWIDRCYVIGAASSTPQEARSWGERGSPAAGATRTVSPPHRSLELGIQEEAASFVFWCHRRWPPMAFGAPEGRIGGQLTLGEMIGWRKEQRYLYLGDRASHLGRVGAAPPSHPPSSVWTTEPHPAPRTAPGRIGS